MLHTEWLESGAAKVTSHQSKPHMKGLINVCMCIKTDTDRQTDNQNSQSARTASQPEQPARQTDRQTDPFYLTETNRLTLFFWVIYYILFKNIFCNVFHLPDFFINCEVHTLLQIHNMLTDFQTINSNDPKINLMKSTH